MSVTFTVAGVDDDEVSYVNVANDNAMELLYWLGLSPNSDLCGEAPASDLAARCRRRLWPIARNEDPGRPGAESGGPGTGTARCISFGRDPGYLPRVATRLLALAERAGEGVVRWS
jgi:hypothetical protein